MDLYTWKDISLNANEEFWQIEAKHKPVKDPILFEGNLLMPDSYGLMRSTYYMLTCSYLISCKGSNRSLNKRSNINWKRLQAVTKGAPPTVYRGFKLSTQTCSETFYAESSQEYDTWLEHFRRCCVLSTLEEDYQLLTELGRGVSSTDMKALDRATQEYVAIKLVNKSSKEAKACLKEVSLVRRLSHESVLQLLKVYDTLDQVAVVFEYAEGGSLIDFIKRSRRLSESNARVLMTKLLGGLEYCHSKLCVHRNLKLENVLLARFEDLSSIKIADFGLAADLEIEQLGKRCGSAGYVAPEILLGRTQSKKVDVFSAGVILYMCLSGTAPFGGTDEIAMLRSNAACSVDLESAYWAHISTTGKDLVRRMMIKEPLNRLSSREALAHTWLTKLQKLPHKPPKIVLHESSITESPRVTSKVMTESLASRMEEAKSPYLSLLTGKKTLFQDTPKSANSPYSPSSPSLPLTPSADGLTRNSVFTRTNPTTPASPQAQPRQVKTTFTDYTQKVSRTQKNHKGSPGEGSASVKVRTMKYTLKRV
jgi:serine/threonine protein kinase